MLLDPVLRRLPQSTRHVTCPWFVNIVLCCGLAILCGVQADSVGGTLLAVAAAILLGVECGHRTFEAKEGGARC